MLSVSRGDYVRFFGDVLLKFLTLKIKYQNEEFKKKSLQSLEETFDSS